MLERFINLARSLGLPRLLRLLTILSIPPTWLEIALLHYRGSFQSLFMWIPVLALPLVFAGGIASLLIQGERRARAIFRPLAWLMTAVGALGTFFHLRGVGRQMGGYYNWKYNVITGPPFPAPPQVALFGLVGVLGSVPSANSKKRRLIRALYAIDAVAFILLAIEAGYSHWKGYFFNKFMFVPIILSPILALLHFMALVRAELTRSLRLIFSVLAILFSLVGFGFHIYNLARRRTGGFSLQNLFYGPPLMAPLQLLAQGVIGVLAVLFEDET